MFEIAHNNVKNAAPVIVYPVSCLFQAAIYSFKVMIYSIKISQKGRGEKLT
jgi:hypothetical protein